MKVNYHRAAALESREQIFTVTIGIGRRGDSGDSSAILVQIVF
jgi:hypothetical protein